MLVAKELLLAKMNLRDQLLQMKHSCMEVIPKSGEGN